MKRGIFYLEQVLNHNFNLLPKTEEEKRKERKKRKEKREVI